MKFVFADSFYFIAQFNASDSAHAKAVEFTRSFTGRMVTTDWVIVEFADAFAQPANRGRFSTIHQRLMTMNALTIIPATRELLLSGVQLYSARPDKSWSLTDCISFEVMRERGIADAATSDHHFEQAGFVALLK